MFSDDLIQRCVKAINDGPHTKVALQFPDSLLALAPQTMESLASSTSSDLFLLADSSYSSCCVDFISAKHVDATLIIHFGESCGTSHDPHVKVLYAVELLKKGDFDTLIAKINAFIIQNLPESLLIVLSPGFDHLEESFRESLSLANIRHTDFAVPSCPFSLRIPDVVLYIGPENQQYLHTMMYYHSSQILNCSANNSFDLIVESKARTNRIISQRYSLLQKVKSINNVGILVADLLTGSCLKATEYLKNICRKFSINATIISLGKLTEAKLSNFPELDCFIYLACPNTMIDQKTCSIPLITPYEFLLKLMDDDASIFTRAYLFDCSENSYLWKFASQLKSSEITETTLATTELNSQLVSIHQRRLFKGLEIDVENRDLEMHDGLCGIASQYTTDKKTE